MKLFVTACNFLDTKNLLVKGEHWWPNAGACVCVCVCVSIKKVPDEWQARQATPAILQVSSSKQNAKNITTSVCVCLQYLLWTDEVIASSILCG